MTEKNFVSRIHYERLERMLDSLKSSTYRSIIMRYEEVEFDSLNSPYFSRHKVFVSEGHGIPKVAIFANGRYIVAVSDNKPDYQENVVTFRVPSFLFKDLFLFPAVAPDWLRGNVWVTLEDRFAGYNDDGKAIFNVTVPSVVGWKVYIENWQGETVEELKKIPLAEVELPSEKEMRKVLMEKWNSLSDAEKDLTVKVISKLAKVSEEEILGYIGKNLDGVCTTYLEKIYIHFIGKGE